MKITRNELIEKIRVAVANIDMDLIDDRCYVGGIGARFEDCARKNGDICNNSKHNGNREDERDFPEYSTEEYGQLEELDGSSAWGVDPNIDNTEEFVENIEKAINPYNDQEMIFSTNHLYIIESDEVGSHEDPDHGEIVLKNAKVIAIIF